MIKLKPCPFCGGEAEVERPGTTRQSCIIACTECGCRHEGPDEYEKCGYQWNMRTTDQAHTAKTWAEEAELAAAQELDEVKAERDALAAHVERIITAWNADQDTRELFTDEWIDRVGDVIEGAPRTSLARRDAEKQAEALEEARDACDGVARSQENLAWMHADTTPDGERVITENGIPYSNKALGATHCRDDIERMITEIRRQAKELSDV